MLTVWQLNCISTCLSRNNIFAGIPLYQIQFVSLLPSSAVIKPFVLVFDKSKHQLQLHRKEGVYFRQ